jgi:hypothetical protein
MSTIFMSSKGGNCTTVTATAFSLIAASRGLPTVLIDLCGDIPSVVGIPEPSTAGVNDWLAEDSTLDAEALVKLGTPVSPGLVVVHRGARFVQGQPRWSDLAAAMSTLPMNVNIDAGTGYLPDELRNTKADITMVVKPCYLALRRATALSRPTNIVVIREEGRALTVKDVGNVIGSPILAEIPYSAPISRAVDAGLLLSRAEQLMGPFFPASTEQ